MNKDTQEIIKNCIQTLQAHIETLKATACTREHDEKIMGAQTQIDLLRLVGSSLPDNFMLTAWQINVVPNSKITAKKSKKRNYGWRLKRDYARTKTNHQRMCDMGLNNDEIHLLKCGAQIAPKHGCTKKDITTSAIIPARLLPESRVPQIIIVPDHIGRLMNNFIHAQQRAHSLRTSQEGFSDGDYIAVIAPKDATDTMPIVPGGFRYSTRDPKIIRTRQLEFFGLQ